MRNLWLTSPELAKGLYDEEVIAEFLTRLTVREVPTLVPIETVIRKYRCIDCGHRHVDGIDVTLDEPVIKPCIVTGYWACDECGSDFYEHVRVGRRDLY